MKRVLISFLAVALRLCGQNLVVDKNLLTRDIQFESVTMQATDCDVVEFGISPGTHPVMRFSVGTPNIGDADLVIGNPANHVADGLFYWSECHGHYHFRRYARYELISKTSKTVWKAAKIGFCMLDSTNYWSFQKIARLGVDMQHLYYDCNTNQGIHRGFEDIYYWNLPGQYFVLDGGDGQPVIPPGTYILRITVNPPFPPAFGEPCPYSDTAGQCRMLPESDYADNVAQVSITIH
jgi:hypothetical protein